MLSRRQSALFLPLAVFAVRARIVEFRRVFRITDIVEMDAVYVIVRSYFTAEGSQIVGGLRLPRVEIPTVSMAYAKFGMGFQYGTVSHTCGSGYLETRYGYKPRMQFHPSFVAFPDGKGQGSYPGARPGVPVRQRPTVRWPKDR